jgi:hypothetical protein
MKGIDYYFNLGFPKLSYLFQLLVEGRRQQLQLFLEVHLLDIGLQRWSHSRFHLNTSQPISKNDRINRVLATRNARIQRNMNRQKPAASSNQKASSVQKYDMQSRFVLRELASVPLHELGGMVRLKKSTLCRS